MRSTFFPFLLLLWAGCGGSDPVEDLANKAARQREAAQLIGRLDDPAVLERVVKLGEVEPVLQATGDGFPEPVRRAACTALGRIGGAQAETRLKELAKVEGPEQRWIRRFASAALAGEPAPTDAVAAEEEATRLLAEPLGEGGVERIVELGAVWPVVQATKSGPNRNDACLALGAIGGPEARKALEEIVAAEDTPHELDLYAHCGLGLLDVPRSLDAVREDIAARIAIEKEGMEYAGTLANPDAIDQVVKLGAVWVLIDATKPDQPQRKRHLAAVALGRVGGAEARDRLLQLLMNHEGDQVIDGRMRLYAAVGLTLLQDPGTVIDLLLALSRINPNDNLAVRAEEGRSGEYFTIDAQICDALLGLGVWGAEEELIEQMRRRHYIRVLIDAYAVLRRRTGLTLPFRYNGSYAARDEDAAAWEKALRETRAERFAAHPLNTDDPRFQRRLQDMLDWLAGRSVNNRYIARKVVEDVGRDAVGPLLAMLAGDNPIGQREAALALGQIGDRAAVPGLAAGLTLEDAHARANCIDALRHLGGGTPEDHAAIRAMLKDEDPGVRAASAHYVAAVGQPEDLAALRTALDAEAAPSTRTAILIALLHVGDQSVIPALRKVTEEGEQQDREAARAALAAEGDGK